MRRLGIPEDICEWFMEVGRRNRNLVKSLWEPLGSSEEQRFEFEAKRGFAQGATESPLGIFFMIWFSVRFALAAAESGCGWLPTACNLTAVVGGQRLWTTS